MWVLHQTGLPDGNETHTESSTHEMADLQPYNGRHRATPQRGPLGVYGLLPAPEPADILETILADELRDGQQNMYGHRAGKVLRARDPNMDGAGKDYDSKKRTHRMLMGGGAPLNAPLSR